MSETQTVDVSATTVDTSAQAPTSNVTEAPAADNDNAVSQQPQAAEQPAAPAIDTTQVLSNALLNQLWNAKDNNERSKLISNADASALALAMANSTAYVITKADPNDSRLNGLPTALRSEMAKQVEKVDRSILLDVSRMLTRHCQRSADEILDSYSDLGPVYAGVPLAVDFGIEAGVRTGSDEDTQRAGVIFGLRLDHFTKVKPQRRIGIPKVTR